jgi:hypothetical protein
MLIKGVTGTGKTGLILSLIFQRFIALAHSVCVVDPVGTLFKKCVEFLGYLYLHLTLMARTPYPAFNQRILHFRDQFVSRVRVLDFAEEDCSGVFYNPLEKKHGMTASECAWQFLKVFERASEGDMNQQMRRQLMLHSSAALVSEAGGSVCDVHLLLMKDDDEIRPFIERLLNRAEAEGREMRLEYVRDYMDQFFTALEDRQRNDWVASSWTALGPFLNDERIYRFLSSPKSNIDFDDICNGGNHLLVHLPRGRGLKAQAFLGALIIERIKAVVMRREDEQIAKDVSLFVDEFHLLFDKEWCVDISTIRNYGMQLILAHQTDGQLMTEDGGEQLLEAVTQNAWTHCIFQLGIEDALRATYRVHRPRGDMKKPETEEVSVSESTSKSHSTTRSIALAISEAFAESEGETISLSSGLQVSFSQTDTISRAEVKSLGLTISEGKNWSRCESKSHGFAITNTESETIVEGSGTADAESASEGESTSDSSGTGFSSGESAGEGAFFSLSDGMNAGLTGMSSAHNAGQGASSNKASNRGLSDSSSHSVGKNLARAISSVISNTKSLARGKSRGVSVSKMKGSSKSVGGSTTESHSESVAKGISYIEGVCRGMGESLSQSIAESRTKTRTHGTSLTLGQSESEQEGETSGTSRSIKAPYMSVDEQARVQSYLIADLPPRHAFVLNRETGAVTKIVTHDIPWRFDTKLGGKDYRREMLNHVRPPAPVMPTKDVFERVEEESMSKRFHRKNAPKGL